MNLIDQMWEHVQATENDRKTMPPPGAKDLWADLNQARYLLNAQSTEISDLREALCFLAETVESLKVRLTELEMKDTR